MAGGGGWFGGISDWAGTQNWLPGFLGGPGSAGLAPGQMGPMPPADLPMYGPVDPSGVGQLWADPAKKPDSTDWRRLARLMQAYQPQGQGQARAPQRMGEFFGASKGALMPGWLEGLAPEQEQEFQRDMMFAPGYRDWRRGFLRQFGEAPDLNDPSYDYRAAWRAGVRPEAYEHDRGEFHWPSSVQQPPRARETPLKAPDHPTAWMEGFMRRYGIDPNEAYDEQLADALRRGLVPWERR